MGGQVWSRLVPHWRMGALPLRDAVLISPPFAHLPMPGIAIEMVKRIWGPQLRLRGGLKGIGLKAET